MTIYAHGVTYDDVLADYPADRASAITASSSGVTTGHITRWIDDAAAQVNTALASRGITDPENELDENAARNAATAIISYCVWKLYQRASGVRPELVTAAREDWREALAELREEKGAALGESSDPTANVGTNFDTTGDKKSLRYGSDFAGF